jgi:arsenate reductase/amino-acid N-acetyltransferase
MAKAPRLHAQPLAEWERDGLRTALVKAGLPADDIGDPEILFWRFEIPDAVPVGFGGLQIYGKHALLRSVVTLPPLRRIGLGETIVAAIEAEAMFRKCRAIYLLTSEKDFFARLGYVASNRKRAPKAIQASRQFASLCPATATLMVKRLD